MLPHAYACASMYTYTHIYTHTHMHVHIRTHMNTHVYTLVHRKRHTQACRSEKEVRKDNGGVSVDTIC